MASNHSLPAQADGLALEGARLQNAKLAGVVWTGCNLEGAHLDNADLQAATLLMCTLDRAVLPGAQLAEAQLENCVARGAVLDGADLSNASVLDTDFSRASLASALMNHLSASGASFRGADLTGASLRDADLSDTDLRGADFTDADLQGTNLNGADIRGATGIAEPSPPSTSELPPEMAQLAVAVAPIVGEVIATAGRSGAVDSDVLSHLEAAFAAEAPSAAKPSIDQGALSALLGVIGEFDGEGLTKLAASLSQDNGADPPPEVQQLLLGLMKGLEVPDDAGVDGLRDRLLGTLVATDHPVKSR